MTARLAAAALLLTLLMFGIIIGIEIEQRLGAPAGPAAAIEDAPPAFEWTVLSRERWVERRIGDTHWLDACLTYATPAGTQRRCRPFITGGVPRELTEAADACWLTARIGDPLPDCWR